MEASRRPAELLPEAGVRFRLLGDSYFGRSKLRETKAELGFEPLPRSCRPLSI